MISVGSLNIAINIEELSFIRDSNVEQAVDFTLLFVIEEYSNS